MDLRTIRFFKNIRQIELSVAAKVNQARLSMAENGLVFLSKDERSRIEKALGCPVDWQTGETGERRTVDD